MKFVLDEQLPPALADWLMARSHAAVHVRSIGLRGATDDRIWRHSIAAAAILVTKDSDFAFRRRLGAGPQILWVRTGNMLTGELLRRFAELWDEIEGELAGGEAVVELR